jgi:hypothetical protein
LEPVLEEIQQEQPEEAGPVPTRPAPTAPGEPAAGEAIPEAPVEAPKEAPAVESRPESAERVSSLKKHILDVLTTDAGTNAATFLRRFQLSNQYRDLRNSSAQNGSNRLADY